MSPRDPARVSMLSDEDPTPPSHVHQRFREPTPERESQRPPSRASFSISSGARMNITLAVAAAALLFMLKLGQDQQHLKDQVLLDTRILKVVAKKVGVTAVDLEQERSADVESEP